MPVSLGHSQRSILGPRAINFTSLPLTSSPISSSFSSSISATSPVPTISSVTTSSASPSSSSTSSSLPPTSSPSSSSTSSSSTSLSSSSSTSLSSSSSTSLSSSSSTSLSSSPSPPPPSSPSPSSQPPFSSHNPVPSHSPPPPPPSHAPSSPSHTSTSFQTSPTSTSFSTNTTSHILTLTPTSSGLDPLEVSAAAIQVSDSVTTFLPTNTMLAFPTVSSNVSQCVTTCLQNAIVSVNCVTITSVECYCGKPGFISSAFNCVESQCPADLSQAEDIAEEFCAVISTSLTFPTPTVTVPLASPTSNSATSARYREHKTSVLSNMMKNSIVLAMVICAVQSLWV